MLIRETYLKKIRPFYHDFGMIKVLTGMRRAGKSVLLEQIRDELLQEGIPASNLVFLNLDKIPYLGLRKPKALLNEISKKAKGLKGNIYLFIDEVQNVKGFEPIIEAFRLEGNFSIFITGSNSYLLSGELSTKLTGRYIEFQIFPFSFAEALAYGKLKGSNDVERLRDYCTYGGLPKRFDYEGRDIDAYIQSVVGEIIKKDLRRKVKDKDLFMRLLTYLSVNSGLTFSASSIVRYLRNDQVRTTNKTVLRYLGLIHDAKLITLLPPDFIKGKRSLSPHNKVYIADFGLKRCLSPSMGIDFSSAVETLINNELLSRDYLIAVGKLTNGEIDFVAERDGRKLYIQAAYLIPDEETWVREVKSLFAIRDACPKYLITLDPLLRNQDGIIHLNLIDGFLLSHGRIS